MIESYPLVWPAGRPRARRRERARFHSAGNFLSIFQGVGRVRAEVKALGASNLVISSNVPVRQDGIPYSNVREPDDPGVAVYFETHGKPRCLPSDHWDRVADNLAAVAAHIHALRGIERWKVGDVEQVWTGYKALPAVGETAQWWQILGFKEPPDLFDHVQLAYRAKIRDQHPDRGGNVNLAAEINNAFAEARIFYGQGER